MFGTNLEQEANRLNLYMGRMGSIRNRTDLWQPGIGGEVVPHQDNSFLYTEPASCTALWLALEDATITNGCLWAIPGSHKNGLVRRFIRDDDGVHFDHPSPSYDRKDFVPLEVKAGSLVVLHALKTNHQNQDMPSVYMQWTLMAAYGHQKTEEKQIQNHSMYLDQQQPIIPPDEMEFASKGMVEARSFKPSSAAAVFMPFTGLLCADELILTSMDLQ
ncbi:hypothetical protein ACLOJK_007352 [Asimina triloba]